MPSKRDTLMASLPAGPGSVSDKLHAAQAAILGQGTKFSLSDLLIRTGRPRKDIE